MDITEFFQQSAGKWVSQRTNHRLAQNQSEGAKSDLIIDVLAQDDPAVVQLCQQQGIDPAIALCGVKLSWSGVLEGNPKPQTGSSLLVLVADVEQPNQGQLLSQSNQATPIRGRYSLDETEVLTLVTDTPDLYAEERIWFANPNFRLRTSVVKRAGRCDVASFCSEIRMGGAPPAAKSATADATN
ncbi:MAG: phycobiliprotein lyase [Cyanobacteria bacterium RM1_2_2]|nr:phycobiliprotein lyase [Cyanobacteria bacterium RM1_2_2]